MAKICIYKTPDDAIQALAKQISDIAAESIKKSGRFSIALSGGNTPRKLFELLAQPPYNDLINWKQTWIAWSDERYVAPTHPDSNVGMAMEALIRHVAIPENQILAPDTSLKPELSAIRYEEIIKQTFGNKIPGFDLTLLGMGDDGHTASLFPGTDILDETSSLIKSVYVPQKSTYRISFTYPLINQSENVAFLVIGEPKSFIITKILGEGNATYPAARVKPVSGNLFWYLDEAAAMGLKAFS